MSMTVGSRIDRRPFASLGHADHGWLNARHHFSFADDYDPSRMHWGAIRVWNDDESGPRSGFPPHPHADMERSEEHTPELQSLMRISYAVFCLKKATTITNTTQ